MPVIISWKMEVSNYLKKFKLLLDYVFEGKVVLNERTTENLLKFLQDKSDNSPGKKLLETPSFSDIVFNSIENLPNATTSVSFFLIEIIGILFKNELQFSKMQMQALQSSSIKVCILGNLSKKINSPGLHLACIKLATVHITHFSGMKLLLEHKVWQHILCSKIHRLTIPIAKAAYNFVSKLIQKLNEYRMETELTEVLEYVVKPIVTSEYLTVEVIDLEMDKALSDKIYAYLYALLTIVTDTQDIPVNHIAPILKNYFLIEHSMFAIGKVTRCCQMLKLINELNFRFYYTTCRHMLFSDKIEEFCHEMTVYYYNCIMLCIRKLEIPAITEFGVMVHIFWSKFEKTYKDKLKFPLTFERNGHKLELSNQLIVHLVEPLIIYAFEHRPGRTLSETQELIDTFHMKFGKIISEHMLSTCYAYRPVIEARDLTGLTIAAIRELFRLKGHLNAPQAGIYFQSLYHVLDIFILSDGAGGLILNQNPMKSPNDVRLVSLVLDALRMLLKDHNIFWYENVEIVNLQEGLMNLLKENFLNTKQIVQVLDLIELCVKKFLSPYMTLLVDSNQDSTLTEIGTVMKTYMCHEDWEVRDSALNLLLTCTDISFVKYVPLQKVIIENKLMISAAKVALSDPEYYAQSTGLKCLAAATRIESIWREVLLDNPHVYLQLIYILRNNPEGIVRKEAVKVLTRIFTNQRISPTFEKSLYDVMTAAALDDLHWEVQLAALQFWKHAINSQLTYRGMIDGKFPSVTFSKEKRKIIMLNDREIIRQLTAIMNYLSTIGCLTVLYECMNEVYNIEVMQQAHSMATELIEILDKYKFGKLTDNSIAELDNDAKVNDEDIPMDLTVTGLVTDDREKVIDVILNTCQSELIMNLHDNYCERKSNEMDADYKLHIPRKEIIHPNKFLETFKDTDYSLIIKNKRNWNSEIYNSLDILLDEILDV